MVTRQQRDQIDQATARGLAWLASQQERDGSFPLIITLNANALETARALDVERESTGLCTTTEILSRLTHFQGVLTAPLLPVAMTVRSGFGMSASDDCCGY